MIGLIKGQVIALNAPAACILTASGVGYDVELPLSSFCQLQINTDAMIWTHLHVREDAQLLFGFIDQTERQVFRQLIKVNGVGVKMALAMLSAMTAQELKHHVEQGSETALTRIPGVGKKTAQRLLIELKDKLEGIEIGTGLSQEANAQADLTNDNTAMQEMRVLAEVEGALISLGYKEKEARQAIKNARLQDDGLNDTQSLLKVTLKQLASF